MTIIMTVTAAWTVLEIAVKNINSPPIWPYVFPYLLQVIPAWHSNLTAAWTMHFPDIRVPWILLLTSWTFYIHRYHCHPLFLLTTYYVWPSYSNNPFKNLITPPTTLPTLSPTLPKIEPIALPMSVPCTAFSVINSYFIALHFTNFVQLIFRHPYLHFASQYHICSSLIPYTLNLLRYILLFLYTFSIIRTDCFIPSHPLPINKIYTDRFQYFCTT